MSKPPTDCQIADATWPHGKIFSRDRGWTQSLGLLVLRWSFPVPALLDDADAKIAYGRLAATRFREHDYRNFADEKQTAVQTSEYRFTERVRLLGCEDTNPKMPSA